MRFEEQLLEGTLVHRKRFRAKIRLKNGDEVMAHCAHLGQLAGPHDLGSKVLLSVQEHTQLALKHHVEIIYAGRTAVSVHSSRPLILLHEGILHGKIDELCGYADIKRVIENPRVSHIDFILQGNGLRSCHITARSVTLAQENIAYYPNEPHIHQLQALQELTNLVRRGHRAMLFLVVQRHDVEMFRPADHLDQQYGQELRDALQRGVEMLCFRCKVGKKSVELDKRIPIDLES